MANVLTVAVGAMVLGVVAAETALAAWTPANIDTVFWLDADDADPIVDPMYVAGTQDSAHKGAFLRVEGDATALVRINVSNPPLVYGSAQGGAVPTAKWTHLAYTVSGTVVCSMLVRLPVYGRRGYGARDIDSTMDFAGGARLRYSRRCMGR